MKGGLERKFRRKLSEKFWHSGVNSNLRQRVPSQKASPLLGELSIPSSDRLIANCVCAREKIYFSPPAIISLRNVYPRTTNKSAEPWRSDPCPAGTHVRAGVRFIEPFRDLLSLPGIFERRLELISNEKFANVCLSAAWLATIKIKCIQRGPLSRGSG